MRTRLNKARIAPNRSQFAHDWITPMDETPLEAAHHELADLYKRLALVRPMSRERISLQMRIARVRRRIAQLERNAGGSQGVNDGPR
jgi:hypothetical protein